jgi:hypothetical protein
VHLAELELGVVDVVHLVAAREGGVEAGVVDLPRQQAGRHRHHRVELAAVELALHAREGEHRGVAVGVVVSERQARLERVLRVAGRVRVVLALGEPARVAARDVAGARDVAHHEDVCNANGSG